MFILFAINALTNILIWEKSNRLTSLSDSRHKKRGETMTQIRKDAEEFEKLKKELFEGSIFIVVDEEDPKQKRYNQLLLQFFPHFSHSIPENGV